MEKRVPASQPMPEAFRDLIEGGLVSAVSRSEPIWRTTQLISTMIRAFERQRNIKITEFERRQMQAVKRELDQLYEAGNGPAKPTPKVQPQSRFSGTSRT